MNSRTIGIHHSWNANYNQTLRFDAVLYIFHEECVAMITMKQKLAYIEAKALVTKIDYPFIEV